MSSQTTQAPERRVGRRGPAFVLTGGGARAAYQVGFLSSLAKMFPDLGVGILTGVSAGAINAASLANSDRNFAGAVSDLVALWKRLTTDAIFSSDGRRLLANLTRWSFNLISGGSSAAPRIRGLVDTSPLRCRLVEAYGTDDAITGIDRNIAAKRLRAFAMTATNYATGQSVTWFLGPGIDPWHRPNRRSVRSSFRIDHVMASAALPLVFPAVFVDGAWYGDGGVRLSAPLAPALHLGADRILAISTRHQPPREDVPDNPERRYPPPAQVAGVLMNAVFLDALDQDAFTLERINRLVRRIPPGNQQGLREVDLFVLRPSVDLGRLAADFEAQLPRAVRFLTRGLGTRQLMTQDWLSMIMFEPDYLARMIEIGEQDAEARKDEIAAFLGVARTPRVHDLETPAGQ